MYFFDPWEDKNKAQSAESHGEAGQPDDVGS